MSTTINTKHSLTTKYIFARNLTYVFYVSLIGLFFASQLIKQQGFNWVALAVQSLPLLIFIPGLISQYYRVYSWLCFIILLYFIIAVMESLKSTAAVDDYLFLCLTVLIFTTSMMCSRYAQRVQKNIVD